jgi:hypothetical protein
MKYKILFVSIFFKYSLFLNCTTVYIDEKNEKVTISDISCIKRTKSSSYYQIPPCYAYKSLYLIKKHKILKINQISVEEEFKLYDSLLQIDLLKSIKNLQIEDEGCRIKHNSIFLKYCSFYMPSLEKLTISSNNIKTNVIKLLTLGCFPKTLTKIRIIIKNNISIVYECDYIPNITEISRNDILKMFNIKKSTLNPEKLSLKKNIIIIETIEVSEMIRYNKKRLQEN